MGAFLISADLESRGEKGSDGSMRACSEVGEWAGALVKGLTPSLLARPNLESCVHAS